MSSDCFACGKFYSHDKSPSAYFCSQDCQGEWCETLVDPEAMAASRACTDDDVHDSVSDAARMRSGRIERASLTPRYEPARWTIGTVIAWEQASPDTEAIFSYAAIKIQTRHGLRWYTTGRVGDSRRPMNDAHLQQHLTRNDVRGVRHASDWVYEEEGEQG